MIRVTIEIEDGVLNSTTHIVKERASANPSSLTGAVQAAYDTAMRSEGYQAARPTLLVADDIGLDRDWAADRLNDAWAVLRTVSHRDGDEALARSQRPVDEGRGLGLMGGLSDDMLRIAAEIRSS